MRRCFCYSLRAHTWYPRSREAVSEKRYMKFARPLFSVESSNNFLDVVSDGVPVTHPDGEPVGKVVEGKRLHPVDEIFVPNG